MAERRQTADGSYTLYDEISGECFHSHKGALTESEHVFLGAGQLADKLQLAAQQNRPLHLLEMGLGTGLNYLLSARAARAAGTVLHYHALESVLLAHESLKALHYQDLDDMSTVAEEYFRLIQHWQSLPPGIHTQHTCSGTLTLHLGDARECILPQGYFDLCYFDAFSPATAPELWHIDELEKYYNRLRPGACWVSYCAQGAVRRSLQNCGFQVERLPGPPGKREMLRATRPA